MPGAYALRATKVRIYEYYRWSDNRTGFSDLALIGSIVRIGNLERDVRVMKSYTEAVRDDVNTLDKAYKEFRRIASGEVEAMKQMENSFNTLFHCIYGDADETEHN